LHSDALDDDYASTISLDCDSAGIINAMPSGCTSNVGGMSPSNEVSRFDYDSQIL